VQALVQGQVQVQVQVRVQEPVPVRVQEPVRTDSVPARQGPGPAR
jgi:hypothetical protein